MNKMIEVRNTTRGETVAMDAPPHWNSQDSLIAKVNTQLTIDDIPADMVSYLYSLSRGQKIEALRIVRAMTGMGLKEAKDYIESLA